MNSTFAFILAWTCYFVVRFSLTIDEFLFICILSQRSRYYLLCPYICNSVITIIDNNLFKVKGKEVITQSSETGAHVKNARQTATNMKTGGERCKFHVYNSSQI